MSIDEHLGPGEEVKAKYETRENKLYATDQRLIRYVSKLFKEKMDDMQYEYIASINIHREGNWKIPLIGIGILFVGLYLQSYFFSGLGAVLIFFGSLYRSGYYTVMGAGGEKMVICRHPYLKWILTSRKDDAEDFVRVIRKQIGKLKETE